MCARAHWASGCMCSRERLSLAAWNLESFPLSRHCRPDTPRVQQEAMTSVASLPDSPRAAAAFIDRSGRSDVSSRTFGEAAPAETAPTPAPASPPLGVGGNEIKGTGRGLGGADAGLQGRRGQLCPLRPGAPEYINSTVSSQTFTPSARPRRAPRPCPCHWESPCAAAREVGRGRGGRGGQTLLRLPLPIHRFSGVLGLPLRSESL